jgi:RNA polymerase sigma-70 factor (ECF subfamily)
MEEKADDGELRNLMGRYQSGEAAGLEELVRRISPILLRYFSGLYASRTDAEDLLQDCWLQIHRSRHTYRPSEPLMPWIFAIARHTRLDGYRKRRRLESRELLVSDIPEHLHGNTPETAHRQDDLEALLVALPDGQREVILMLKVSGMSLEEVARATSSTVGAVKQKAHRAYLALRRALQEKDKKDVRYRRHE